MRYKKIAVMAWQLKTAGGRGKPGCTVIGGFFLRGLGRFWEGLRVFESIAAHYSNIVRGGKTPQNRSGIVRGRLALPGGSLAGAERQPAAAGFARFPILPKPSQIFPILSRGTQAFALQQHIACRRWSGQARKHGYWRQTSAVKPAFFTAVPQWQSCGQGV